MSVHWTDKPPNPDQDYIIGVDPAEPDPNETPTWMIVVLIIGMGYVVGQVIRSML